MKVSFDTVIDDITCKFTKIKQSEYLSSGKYHIIDQGSGFIAGYTNTAEFTNSSDIPVIIFGDHTKILKYVDFPIALGADGVKALKVKESDIHPKYIYYFLRSVKLPEAGYSRHYKYLKQTQIHIPPLKDQIRIASLLSRIEELIAKRKESIRLLDEYVKSVFLEMFGDPVRNEKGWEVVKLNKLGSLDRGVSKHRPRNAPELLGGKYPLIQTGDVSNSGLYILNYTQTYSDIGIKQSKMWPKGTLCITIAANIAKTSILNFDACFPDSIVGFVSFQDASNIIYVHFLFKFFQRILEKTAPQAAQKNINLEILRNLKVPKPDIKEQSKFVIIVEEVERLKEKYRDSLVEMEKFHGSGSQRAFRGEM